MMIKVMDKIRGRMEYSGKGHCLRNKGVLFGLCCLIMACWLMGNCTVFAVVQKEMSKTQRVVAEKRRIMPKIQRIASEKQNDKYNKYSNQKAGWGLCLNKQHEVPVNGGSEVFDKYNARYVVKTNQKQIYLTFDCGYENGYTPKILDILKKNNVKAIFFVTKPYIEDNADLVKRMKAEGHLVGNHTCRHLSTPSLSPEEIQQELNRCAAYMKEKTGYDMDPYFRPPMGEWSKRTLKVVQDMGYSTVFWSMAFMDYDVSNQPGKAAIHQHFMENYHKGAVVLLHVISQSDTEALNSILTDMMAKGYSFHILSELANKKRNVSVSPIVGIKKDALSKLTISYVNRESVGKKKVIQSINAKGQNSVFKVTYFNFLHKPIHTIPKHKGTYYVRVYMKGDSVYKPAVSKMVKVSIR